MIAYKHFSCKGVLWRTLPFGLSLLSPPSASHSFDYQLKKSLLSIRHRIFFVRWEENFDKLDETQWWHIVKDRESGYELESYKSSTRNEIRRGLKQFDCRKVSREYIVENCYEVYRSTALSYSDVGQVLCCQEYKQIILSLPDRAEFWAVIDLSDGECVGFAENYIESNTCFINSIWILPPALKQYASYSLFFFLCHHYLGERSFRYVSDGARNLSHPTNIHHFLISKFKFRKAYSHLRVVYSSWLYILIKIFMPLKPLIKTLPFNFFQKVTALLAMEDIRISCIVK